MDEIVGGRRANICIKHHALKIHDHAAKEPMAPHIFR
jgi:hypothetical protein